MSLIGEFATNLQPNKFLSCLQFYITVNVVESGDNFLFLYETINYDYGKLYFSKPY